jgi:hypothetical protein
MRFYSSLDINVVSSDSPSGIGNKYPNIARTMRSHNPAIRRGPMDIWRQAFVYAARSKQGLVGLGAHPPRSEKRKEIIERLVFGS